MKNQLCFLSPEVGFGLVWLYCQVTPFYLFHIHALKTLIYIKITYRSSLAGLNCFRWWRIRMFIVIGKHPVLVHRRFMFCCCSQFLLV